MKKVAIIKDLFRNTPHVVISDNDGIIESKSLTEYGRQIIAESYISADIEQIALPEGFVCTGFKSVTPSIEKMLSSFASQTIETKSLGQDYVNEKPSQTLRMFSERHANNVTSEDKPSSELSIAKFSSIESKMNVIDYKARQFKVTSRISSIISPIKSGKFGFDTTKSAFVPRKNNSISLLASEIAEKSVSESLMGRFLSDDGKRDKTKAKRRLKRRARNLSPVVDGQKMPSGKKRITISIKSKLG
jgi:hypothetical protein